MTNLNVSSAKTWTLLGLECNAAIVMLVCTINLNIIAIHDLHFQQL